MFVRYMKDKPVPRWEAEKRMFDKLERRGFLADVHPLLTAEARARFDDVAGKRAFLRRVRRIHHRKIPGQGMGDDAGAAQEAPPGRRRYEMITARQFVAWAGISVENRPGSASNKTSNIPSNTSAGNIVTHLISREKIWCYDLFLKSDNSVCRAPLLSSHHREVNGVPTMSQSSGRVEFARELLKAKTLHPTRKSFWTHTKLRRPVQRGNVELGPGWDSRRKSRAH